MSIENLCQDTITIQTETATTGDTWGVEESATNLRTASCFVQEMSSSESARHGIVGSERAYMIFFPADPGITKSNRLKRDGLYLRVEGHYTEGRPGETMLWVVLASYSSARQEPAETS